jgi:cytoskeletal protein CcmA (bactofilin family)
MFGLFRSSSPSPLPSLSLIGDETTIAGDRVSGSGDLRIEGTVRADIERDGRVVVAHSGTVEGTVRAQSIRVAGTVRGALHAEDTLVLTASANVRAHLEADALTIESGADFKGEVYDAAGSTPEGDHSPPAPPFIDEVALPVLPVNEEAASE